MILVRVCILLILFTGCNSQFEINQNDFPTAVDLSTAVLTDTLLSSQKSLSLHRDVVSHSQTEFLKSTQLPSNSSGLYLGEWANIGSYNVTYYDENSGILFLGGNYKLVARDTKKTPTVLDDEIVLYDNTTTPAISGDVQKLDYDGTNHIIYWGGEGYGIHAIATNNTIDISDDTDAGSYLVGGPFLSISSLLKIQVDEVNDLVYVATGIRIEAIDRQGTPTDTTDDTLHGGWDHNSTPNLTGGWVIYDFHLDQANDMLIASTYGPGGNIHFFDTKGTRSFADDTIDGNTVMGGTGTDYGTPDFIYDESTGYIFIIFHDYTAPASYEIHMYSTNKTPTTADDTLIKKFTYTDLGFTQNVAFDMAFHSATNKLYVQSSQGLTTISLNTLATSADDVTSLNPLLQGYINYNYTMATDQLNETIYLPGNDGFIQYSPGKLINQGDFLSTPIPTNRAISSINYDHSGIGSTEIRYRTLDTINVDSYPFTTSGIVGWGDFNGWGSPAGTITNNTGVISLSNFPSGQGWSDTTFDTGKAGDFYPRESIIHARFRANCSVPVTVYVYEDDWYGDEHITLNDSEWVDLYYSAARPFSVVGFEIWTGNNAIDISTSCTSVDIDSIEVLAKDSFWSAWSAPVTSGNLLSQNFTGISYLQYKASLTSTNGTSSPSINNISVNGAYILSGSAVVTVNFPKTRRPTRLSYNASIPAGTTLAFSYSTDNGATWNSMSTNRSRAAFPDNLSPLDTIQIKMDFTTNDENYSPSLSSLTIYGR